MILCSHHHHWHDVSQGSRHLATGCLRRGTTRSGVAARSDTTKRRAATPLTHLWL
jgi:hypothetical protein